MSKKKYICDICGKELQSQGALNLHRHNKHIKKQNKPDKCLHEYVPLTKYAVEFPDKRDLIETAYTLGYRKICILCDEVEKGE